MDEGCTMFGYIKADVPDLKVRENELYKAVYCGLCRTQRKYTGWLSSLFLSYDFVFLYFLRAEANGEETKFRTARPTPFHPNRRNIALTNSELIYCACAAALLEYYKIKDDLCDEKKMKRFAARLLLPVVRHGMKKAKKHLSLPEDELKDQLEAQAALEKNGNAGPEPSGGPSGEIFGLFASYGINDGLKAFALQNIGRQIGGWLYLTDAADDLEKDRKNGAFNPFLKEDLRKDDLLAALDNHCEQAELMLRRLPVYDAGYRAILMNIMTRGLHNEAQRVIYKEKNTTDV